MSTKPTQAKAMQDLCRRLERRLARVDQDDVATLNALLDATQNLGDQNDDTVKQALWVRGNRVRKMFEQLARFQKETT